MTYFLKRLLLLLPTVWATVTLVFFLIHVVPGNPVDAILGEQASANDRARLTQQLQLDQPLLVQYKSFLQNLVRGDLGNSLFDKTSVRQTIQNRLGHTLQLALSAMFVAIGLAIPLGLISAIRKDHLLDHSAMFFALLGISIPHFYLGPLLILLFAIQLGWLPVTGEGGFYALILPTITLGTAMAAMLTRMTRASMLDVLQMDFIRTAKAKGLSPFKVYTRHAFRASLLPIVTIIGLQFGALLAGAVVTEKIFNRPGVGSLLLQSIQRRDYPMVQGCVLTIALTFIAVNLLTDLLYASLDPRLRLGKS